MEEIALRLPLMCEVMWHHRETIFADFATQPDGLSGFVVEILSDYVIIIKMARHEDILFVIRPKLTRPHRGMNADVPSDPSFVAHLSLYLWYQGGKNSTWHHYLAGNVNRILAVNVYSDRNAFIKAAIPTIVRTDNIVDFAYRAVTHDLSLLDMHLTNTIQCVVLILACSVQPMRASPVGRSIKSLITAMARAFHRQICTGDRTYSKVLGAHILIGYQ